MSTEINDLWELNFGPIVASMEKYPEQHHCHWLWRRAVENPNEEQVWEYEENGYKYKRVAVYDPETKIMTTNLAGCPHSYSHHIGLTCKICNQKD